MKDTPRSSDERILSGVPGLDEILGAGLTKNGLYLLQGDPGVGKTTFGLQFLLQGLREGERALYVSFSESEKELKTVARSHGWDIAALNLYEFSAAEQVINREAEQTMFHPAEVELEETTRPILAEVSRIAPARIVIDSLSEIRLLAREPLRYRRQLLQLKHFFIRQDCTVLLIDDEVSDRHDDIVRTLAHGVISLEKQTPVYGAARRRLSVEKLRGVEFRDGYHDYRIETGGIVVYPRLVASSFRTEVAHEVVSSGVPELDTLLAGGLDRGTSNLVMGAAGTGKSSLAAQYALSEASRGEKAVLFLFEESTATWMMRARSLGWTPEPYLASGHLKLIQIDPAELTPGELACRVRSLVEKDGVRFVGIDSINGYLQSVPEERFLVLHLHEMLAYLGHRGVLSFIVVAQNGLLGPAMVSPIDISYLADTVLLLRYFETAGEIRQAISVVKKRSGKHERTLREFKLDANGLRVGAPLEQFQGVLTGVPVYRGDVSPLLRASDVPPRG